MYRVGTKLSPFFHQDPFLRHIYISEFMPGFDIFYSLIILKSAAGKLPKRITVMPDSHIITRQVNSKLTYIL